LKCSAAADPNRPFCFEMVAPKRVYKFWVLSSR
jgi:hypothetical protein